MRRSVNIAIAEFSNSHGEVLPSIIYYLNKLGIVPHLYINRYIYKTNPFVHGKSLEYKLHIVRRACFWNNYFPLLLHDILIVNTIEPYLLYQRFSKRRKSMISIIHNADLLKNDSMFKSISNTNYISLAKHIYDNYQNNGVMGWISPIYFGEFEDKDINIDDNIMIFGVVGSVDLSRRNYLSLIPALKEAIKLSCRPFKIDIIGDSCTNDGIYFRGLLQKEGLEKYFLFYENKLSYQDLFVKARKCHFILPLQDMSNPCYNPYFEEKVSGSINIAVSFGVPVICSKHYVDIYGLEGASLHYDEDSLITSFLRALSANNVEINKMSDNMRTLKNKLIEKSQNNFNEIIEKVLN